MRKVTVVGFLLIVCMAGVLGAQPSGSGPSTVRLEDLRQKERELRMLIEHHNQLLEKARQAQGYEEKKRYMEEAAKLKNKIKEIENKYRKMVQAYLRRARSQTSQTSAPVDDAMWETIRSLEKRINALADTINARIAQAETETHPDRRAVMKRDIDRMIQKLERLKREHRILLERYREKVKRASKTPPAEKRP